MKFILIILLLLSLESQGFCAIGSDNIKASDIDSSELFVYKFITDTTFQLIHFSKFVLYEEISGNGIGKNIDQNLTLWDLTIPLIKVKTGEVSNLEIEIEKKSFLEVKIYSKSSNSEIIYLIFTEFGDSWNLIYCKFITL